MPKTTEASLTDLLDEWAGLDPERCRSISDLADGGVVRSDMRGWMLSWLGKPSKYTIHRGHEGGVNEQAVIQAAVQEAVEKEGWDLTLEINANEADKATIRVPYPSGVTQDRVSVRGFGGALVALAALIKTLRSQAE